MYIFLWLCKQYEVVGDPGLKLLALVLVQRYLSRQTSRCVSLPQKEHLTRPQLPYTRIIMSQSYISLDWRQAPSTTQTIDRIHSLLTHLDANGELSIRLSESRGPMSVSLVEQDGKQMILRTDYRTVRKGKSQLLYFSRMYSMTCTISELLTDKQQVMARFVEYKEVSSP